ncbi:hypothetical protein [Micromonospora sp. bgisy143]|uniref:hypothetical protein n=1 Tax=Micromonospora sp. bgisy143 TaxID=3413790 RepID=UPI003EBB871B
MLAHFKAVAPPDPVDLWGMRLPEEAPELAEPILYLLAGGAGWLLSPQDVDEPVDRYRFVGIDQESGEKSAIPVST